MFDNRIMQVAMGFAVLFVFRTTAALLLSKIAPYLYLVGIILLILVDLIGTTSKGAQRWLDLGLFRFQPSELIKLSVPLMVATFLGKRQLPPSFGNTIIAFSLNYCAYFIGSNTTDLGTSILVAASGIFVVFLAGMSWKLIATAVIGVAGFIPVLWFYLMHDYQKHGY